MTRLPGYVSLVIRARHLMTVAPIRATALAEALGVGRRTVERIVRGLEAEGVHVTRERSGREVFYRIDDGARRRG